MKGIDPAMREKFMGMMKELVGNEDHFNVMMIDMMAPKEPNTLDITCDVEKGYWPVRQLLADGYATAAIYASSLAPDEGDSWKQEGLYPLFYEAGERPADGFGCLTAWGFGAQRVLDALLTCPEIDPKRISVAGHSRAGKAALWAAVQDERFATVLVNNSGCCGVAMNVGKLGERVASMCQMMPRWFCKNFLKYSAMAVEQMPFDQDELLAAMAPRPVFVTSGNRDYWSDPEAEFRSVYLYTNRRGTAGMANGIFHQIDEYLFDQGGIHGNNQHFLRNRNIYNGIGKTLANPTDSLTYNFFYDFILLFQIGCAACNFRNRKQIFYHVNQPFCIMLDIH